MWFRTPPGGRERPAQSGSAPAASDRRRHTGPLLTCLGEGSEFAQVVSIAQAVGAGVAGIAAPAIMERTAREMQKYAIRVRALLAPAGVTEVVGERL